MSRAPLSTLISIHDVMPHTLPRVHEIMRRIEARGHRPVTLLVSPGFEWDEAGLDTLRAWQADGHELAGHGWHHRAERVEGWYHRLHSAVISRGVAEHLALEPDRIASLIKRCYEWFLEHELDPPGLYVPPAWAMGRISRKQLRDLPFRWYETLTGIYDSERDRMRRLPMVGFEADTATRAGMLRLWNGANLAAGRALGRPVRIAIHPDDLHLRLGDSLPALLEEPLHAESLDGPGRQSASSGMGDETPSHARHAG